MKYRTLNELSETLTTSHSQSTDNDDNNIKRYVTQLRLQFLIPIVITLLFTLLVFIGIAYFLESRTIDSNATKLQSYVDTLFQTNIQKNAKALNITLDLLKADKEITSALLKHDRQELLKLTSQIYKNINRHYGITHLYFSDPDRVNILRAHKPEKYGDTITRHTTLAAQNEGIDSYGIELGAMGTLTLRYVQPWYEEQTHELLGFVELGIEVDQTLDIIQHLYNIDLFLLIKKQYLDRKGWEEGMRTFSKEPDWYQFSQTVVSTHGHQEMPEVLSAHIRTIDFDNHDAASKTQFDQNNQYSIFQPLQDVSGQVVGSMIMLIDTTKLKHQIRQSISIGAVAVIAAAIILILLFYWFVGRIGRHIAHNELKLHRLASQDELTGLFNRRQLDQMLNDSIEHYMRYDQPVSLLMIDIDHFKQVNDTYGHAAGDTILVELGKQLELHARTIDRVCRYGGEEFIILLPETDIKAASSFAQRLCDILQNVQWDIGNGIQLPITVSIGIASCPDHADTSSELMIATDKALYAAKNAGRNCVYNYSDIVRKTNLTCPET